ncbi:MAG: hypothetical protein HYY02_06675 [Chloroflexi bacterium]|nr:hypothetical protein [Chloroflexota bacterium]
MATAEGGYLEELWAVQPGDSVEIWLETAYIVRTVLQCREALEGRVSEWRWLFLDDGSLLEASPDGYYRYREHQVVRQGSELYEELVAQDGLLVRFEERVRRSTVGRRPVHCTIDGREYRVANTGTFTARVLGDAPEPLPWKTLSGDQEQNTYFGMVSTKDEAQVMLGLWTTHICLSAGSVLEPAQISRVYRRG